MLTICRIAAICGTILLTIRPHANGATIVNFSEDCSEGGYSERTTGLRMLKHHGKARNHPNRHHHTHHKAIQDMFSEEQAKLASHDNHEQIHDPNLSGGSVDDAYYAYNHMHHDNKPVYHGLFFSEYLDKSIPPRPFQNCVPESFYEAKTHGKKHHHKGHHKENYLGGYQGIGDEIVRYSSKSKKAGKKGKGSGFNNGAKAVRVRYRGKSKSAKASKSAKSKGYAGRQRRLTGRHGHNNVQHFGYMGGRHHHAEQGRVNNRVGHRKRGEEIAEPRHVVGSMELNKGHVENYGRLPGHETKKMKKHKGVQHHHSHARAQKKEDLPLCPNVAPKRRTFGPVPTVAPRLPSETPAPTIGRNETMAASADKDVEPIEEDAVHSSNLEAPAGTQRILLESALSYGFFEGTQLIEPTMDEVDALLERTSTWYDGQLKAIFPMLDSFMAEYLATNFDVNAADPVRIEFNANAFFPEGAEIPTPNVLFGSMEGLNYQDYIMQAVWTQDMTGGIFEQTEMVGFSAKVAQ